MDLWKKLKKWSMFETEEDINNFISTLELLEKNSSVETLNKAFSLFYDDCEYPELMEKLISFVEQYPDNVYIPVLSRNIKQGLSDYPEYLISLFFGVFNNDNCYQILKKEMKNVDKQSFLELLSLIEEESEIHIPQCQELRGLLGGDGKITT